MLKPTRPLPRRRADKRKFWQHHVRRQARGKLTQRRYCERHGLGYASFVRWRGLLSQRKHLQDQAVSVSSFIPVQVKALQEPDHTIVQADTDSIDLILPSGMRIEGITSTNLDLVAALASRL